jgi:hypothetical protein
VIVVFHPLKSARGGARRHQKEFAEQQMSKAVEEAQKMVRLMINRESRGPGDRVNAMRRLAQRYKLSFNLFWSLSYRPPADLMCGVFDKLKGAYEDELRRAVSVLDHERKLIEEREIRTNTRIGEALLGVADLLAGQESETVTRRRARNDNQ